MLSKERKIELIKWYYSECLRDLYKRDEVLEVEVKGNVYKIKDIVYNHSICLIEKGNGTLCESRDVVNYLFLANTTDMGELLEFFWQESNCTINEVFHFEIREAEAQGHIIKEIKVFPWSINFCTLVCEDEELGQYYIHTDDGDTRASYCPSRIDSCQHPSTITPLDDEYVIHKDDLKGHWGSDS